MKSPKQPQVAGRGLVVRDNKVLLVRDGAKGDFWILPGGRCNFGEDIESCAKREVYEETGLTVSVGNLFAVSEFIDDAESFHIMQCVFLCTIESGELSDDWQDKGGSVHESRFFSLDDLEQEGRIYPVWLREGRWIEGAPYDPLYKGITRK